MRQVNMHLNINSLQRGYLVNYFKEALLFAFVCEY